MLVQRQQVGSILLNEAALDTWLALPGLYRPKREVGEEAALKHVEQHVPRGQGQQAVKLPNLSVFKCY